MAALRRELDGRPTTLVAGAIGVAGAVGVVIGALVEPHRALPAYLAAWSTATFTAVGGLAVLAIGYAANARWPAAVRRMAEAVAAALVPLAVLFIPLIVVARWVWPWVEPSPAVAHAIAPKRGYLWLPTFTVRAAIYFAVWIIAAEKLRRASRRRDESPSPAVSLGVDALHRERRFSAAMLPLIGLAVTFAAIDWLMSMQPAWSSTVFGLYVITGTLGGGLAAVIVVAWRGVAAGAMPLTGNHFHAMGRLMLAFVILWAYLAYFQAFLIQIADRPDEVTFYLARTADGWRAVTLLLVALHFALPFPLLVSRRLKHRARYLGGVAVMLLVAHYLDMWWLVMPTVAGPLPSWTDLAALCAVGGLTVAATAWRLRGMPLLPVGDPYLASGLLYESTT